jgi:hypothetical protein
VLAISLILCYSYRNAKGRDGVRFWRCPHRQNWRVAPHDYLAESCLTVESFFLELSEMNGLKNDTLQQYGGAIDGMLLETRFRKMVRREVLARDG